MDKTFKELTVHQPKQPVVLVVAGAEEKKLLQAVSTATSEGWVSPIFIGIGSKTPLLNLIHQWAPELEKYTILSAENAIHVGELACHVIQHGGVLMKGLMETNELLRAILHCRKEMLDGPLLSHISLLQVPYRRGVFGFSDTSVLISPSLEEKAEIIRQGVRFLRRLGCTSPKVAVLSAVERANSSMPDTLEAVQLARMGEQGSFGSCLVDGPVSFDIAMDRTAAKTKGYPGHIQGDADFLLAPDIVSGNLLGKCFNYTPDSQFAGFLLGTKVPVILTSRASSLENKLLSIRLGAVLAGGYI